MSSRVIFMRIAIVLIFMLVAAATAFGQESDSPVLCTADLKWLNTNTDLKYSRGAQIPASLSILAHRGSTCPTEITLTATYLTENLDFICSGTMRQALVMSSDVQSFNIEIRPFAQLDFMRWRNEPGTRGVQQGKRLVCSNLDGTSDVGDNDRQGATWIRLSVGAVSRGGVAVEEVMLRITP